MDTSRIPIGSKLLGIENPKDQDFCCIVEDKDKIPDSIYENKTYGEDIRIVRKNELLDRLEFKKFNFYIIYNYQYDKNINPIFAQFYKYNILDYSESLKSFLKKIVSRHWLNFSKRVTAGNRCCTKQIYHIAYNLFILQNKSTILTEEQKNIIQTIHDKRMPIDYLDKLEDDILNL